MKKLNRKQIKYIAVLAMIIDHIAWAFVPLQSFLGFIMHFIGRFTGPCMIYFLYEGFCHTSNKKKYARRLFIFALLSWIPFCSFINKEWCIKLSFGVIYSLFLGFLAMYYEEKHENNWSYNDSLVILGIVLLSSFGDWPIYCILWPFFLYKYRNNEKDKWQSFWIINAINIISVFMSGEILTNLYQLGCIIPGLVLQFCYSNEEGKKSLFSKYFFYIIYPLHLIILTILEIKFI